MKIIIDSRMREVEKNYIKKYGELVELKYQDSVYDEISSHPDIFVCRIKNEIIKAKNLELEQIKNIGITGKEELNKDYPEDVKYNVCCIGNFVIHNFKYTDENILKIIEKERLTKIDVAQGYSNCSIANISDNSCITTDMGIYNILKKHNIDVLLVKEQNIKLLDKKLNESNMQGFIGGATAVIDNKFILFGDSNFLNNKKDIIEFIKKYNLELVEFKGLDIIDYGGIVII